MINKIYFRALARQFSSDFQFEMGLNLFTSSAKQTFFSAFSTMAKVTFSLLLFFCISPTHALPDAPQIQHFLVISDVHLNKDSFQSMNWRPDKSSIFDNTDQKNFDYFMNTIAEQIKTGQIPKPKFLLYLGDMVGHLRFGKQFVWKNQVAVLSKFTQTFPDIPIFYTFGNNDAYSKNYGSFTSYDLSGQIKNPLDAAKFTGKWHNGFISMGAKRCGLQPPQFPCVLTQNQTEGYYSAYIAPKLRLINLNTVMFSRHHSTLLTTAEAQLAWLEQQLQAAQLQHESVIIAMHIPIGKNVYNDDYFLEPPFNQRLIKLIRRYHASIMGVLAAHTHMDEIKIIMDKASHPLAGIYLIPALSTSHGNAPAIRSYSYALLDDQWQFIDYTTYYFIKDKVGHRSLQKLYSFRDIYCTNSQRRMTDCLFQVNPLLMGKYYTAGNDKVNAPINFPENIFIKR